jgi:hypothetical protein
MYPALFLQFAADAFEQIGFVEFGRGSVNGLEAGVVQHVNDGTARHSKNMAVSQVGKKPPWELPVTPPNSV